MIFKKTLFIGIVFFFSLAVNAQMVLEFNTNLSDGTTVTLPLTQISSVTVDWGDGNTEDFVTADSGNKDHTYSSNGIYTVSINGDMSHYGASDCANIEKLTKVTSFGDIGITDLTYAFYNATNLIEAPSELPSNTTGISFIFYGATSFNDEVNSWDISNVTDLSFVFCGAEAFNQSLSDWDLSNVTTTYGMFYGAYDFNQPLNWNMTNVTVMTAMFAYATSFNQNIESWDVSNVTHFSFMFQYATAFNQPLADWDFSSAMGVTHMFEGATSFNQDISDWNTTNMLSFDSMFKEATSFDQNIGSWNISNVTNMSNMFWGAGLSISNYDALLIGWSSQSINSNLTFFAGNSKYSCVAVDARNILTDANWIITDGGQGDETDPTITCVENQIKNLSEEQTFYTVSGTEFDLTEATDNCEIETIVNNFNSTETLTGAEFPIGTTTVTWTVTDATGNQSECTFDVVVNEFVGVSSLSNANISIYPNPTTGIINLTVSARPVSVSNIEITDITGKIIKQLSIDNKKSSIINLENQPSGIYFIKIQTENKIINKKIIKN